MSKRAVRVAFVSMLITAAAAVALPAGGAVALFHGGTIVSLNTNQSSNWGGYNQGAIEKGTVFNSITGDWTVPTATKHTNGEDEYSSSWIGIGGGCPESTCAAPSATLIQTGTEQDVSGSNGQASYSAWWELIPAPSVTIDSLSIHAGDHMHASIAEAVPNSNVWNMTLTDVTTGQSFSQTVPYSSTHDTAEWIEETPLLIGSSGASFTAMPNLSTVNFDLATVDGANPGLVASEEIQLVDGNGHPVATPSGPDVEGDGFNVCIYAASCGAPSSSATTTRHRHKH
jgi:hypothetical protein